MHCHLLQGDWSFHLYLSNDKKKRIKGRWWTSFTRPGSTMGCMWEKNGKSVWGNVDFVFIQGQFLHTFLVFSCNNFDFSPPPILFLFTARLSAYEFDTCLITNSIQLLVLWYETSTIVIKSRPKWTPFSERSIWLDNQPPKPELRSTILWFEFLCYTFR